MPRSTLHGDDPAHQLSNEEKDKFERGLREDARTLINKGMIKKSKELNHRAVNISRKESRRAQHH